MNKKRIGSEKKLKYNNLNYIISTFDKHNPKAIDVTLEFWLNAESSVDDSIKAIRKHFIKNISTISRKYFKGLKTYIIDYDYPTTKISNIKNKWTFVKVDITLFPVDGTSFIWDNTLINNASNFAGICFDLLNSLNSEFKIRSKKKIKEV